MLNIPVYTQKEIFQKLEEIQIVYPKRINKLDCPKLTSSREVYEVLLNHEELQRNINMKECFYFLGITRANKIKYIYKVSEGGLTATYADPKYIIPIAAKSLCNSIILVHNHPSGNAHPSESDKALTKKIKEGAELFDIIILDHIIITEDSFYSFADEGIL